MNKKVRVLESFVTVKTEKPTCFSKQAVCEVEQSLGEFYIGHGLFEDKTEPEPEPEPEPGPGPEEDGGHGTLNEVEQPKKRGRKKAE